MVGRRAGRPKAKDYKMQNEVADKEDLFLYAPESSLPESDTTRFLKLCDLMLLELDPEEVTPTDIDEVAQYNRTRMLKDFILKECKRKNSVEDNNIYFIGQLEKLQKQMDQHLGNLKARRSDRIKGSVSSKNRTIADLVKEYDNDKSKFTELQKTNKKEVREFEEEFQDADPLAFIEKIEKGGL